MLTNRFRLKDSDVTWLYGPLHTVIKNIEEEDRFAKPKLSSTEDTLNLMTPSPNRPGDATPQRPLKSALKKLTASDLLKRSASELHTPALSQEGGMSITEANKQLKAFSPSVIATHRQPKLRFNQHVEQCVALTSSDDDRQSTSRHRVGFTRFSAESDEEDDGRYSDDENAIVIDYGRPRNTIRKIAPARLKTSSQSEQETDDVSSLSSSSASSVAGGSSPYRSWMVNESCPSSDDESIPRKRRDQDDEHDDEPQAIQWVGQSCVYNVHAPSDYDDYEFDDDDDDDWDTDEENRMPSPPIPPPAPTPASPPLRPPRGQQVPPKSPPVSGPSTVEAGGEPSISRVSSHQKMFSRSAVASSQLQQQQQRQQRATNSSEPSGTSHNSSVLEHFAQWASSYLWPKSSSSSTTSNSTMP